MKPNIFMSYSRREVGFVDQLTGQLEREGFQVWLDYRSLIPGSPWKTQIEKGLDQSQVILLVVSKESMASRPKRKRAEHSGTINPVRCLTG